jgi:hypothetical protein
VTGGPPPGVPIVPLCLPLFVTAGAVRGVAIGLARSEDELFYLVDNASIDGPPVWVHEAEVERCAIAPVGGRPA